jgi:hypothetical protein
MCEAQSEGTTDHAESAGMGSDVEIIDEMEHEQPDVDTTRDLDWEMDKEPSGSEQGSETDSTPDSEPTHLILKESSPPHPGMTSTSAPSDLVSESTSKPTVTSAIRMGLTNGVKTGLFQFFSQGTREQNNEYHARETEHSEEIMQDDQYQVMVARVQQAETKKDHARA